MSWAPGDVDQFCKGLSDKQKKQWIGTANGVLRSCLANGGNENSCSARAVKVANSKFEIKIPFNPVFELKDIDIQFMKSIQNVPPPIHRILKKAYQEGISTEDAWKKVYSKGWSKNEEGNWVKKKFDVTQIPEFLTPDMKERLENAVNICIDSGGDPGMCMSNALAKLQTIGFEDDDCEWATINGAHICISGNDGGADEPQIRDKVRESLAKSSLMDPSTGKQAEGDRLKQIVESHRRIAKQKIRQDREIQDAREKHGFGYDENSIEMEIFRVGTHNGDNFTEKDLEEMANNYHALKDELRPKLKITHRETQQTLAGLASYGDVIDVYMKKALDGSRRLFAKLNNVPNEVRSWIKDRRFPERSIELYPQFQLGTKDDSPVFKNVLKAIALLGHEMPAVTGMAPILMEECLECQGTVCFKQSFASQNFSEDETQKIKELSSSMKVLETELSLNTGGGE